VNYYNEIDKFAAAWLRKLIAAGHIAPGEVDERDIRDVTPRDLRGFTQCHFFAGIGVWSYALRLAGWPDDRPLWTGSCPCQPFSAAGAGAGFTDERHLWPSWHHLIRVCRPPVIFGEQVASLDALRWFDLVQADLEGEGYAVGAGDLCAAGVGAPHIRQRLFFVADSSVGRDGAHYRQSGPSDDPSESVGGRNISGFLADPDNAERGAGASRRDDGNRAHPGWEEGASNVEGRSGIGFMGNSSSAGLEGWCLQSGEGSGERTVGASMPTGGFWADAEWLPCRDEKYRPVEPGIEPLAHGAPSRLVCVCAFCESETVIHEGLPTLRKIGRSHEGRFPQEILQRDLLSSASIGGATNQREHRTLSSEDSLPREGVCSLWRTEAGSNPSQRPEPAERLAGQSAASVLQMPSLRTLTAAAVAMCRLWSELQGGVSPEPQQNMLCGLCERVGPHLCLQEMGPSRVGRLRGYGNAIVAPLAAEFIAAYRSVRE
jgi:DNA (cytosine-5)-methyltransferase 1